MRSWPWTFLSSVFGLDFPYCFLLAIIWRQWLQYSVECEKQLIKDRPEKQKEFSELLRPERGEDFLNKFVQWIIASFLLGLSFIFDAFFYYGAIAREQNDRYKVDACLDLVVWAVS